MAELGEQIIGTASVLIEQKLIRDGGKVAYVEDVVVDEPHRLKGIGSELVRQAVKVARLNDCYKVVLSCGENNVPFYESLGFRRHEITMRLDLK